MRLFPSCCKFLGNYRLKSIIEEPVENNQIKFMTKEDVIELKEYITLLELPNQTYPIDYSKKKIIENCSKYRIAIIKNCRYFQYKGLDLLSINQSLLPFLTINKDYMNLPSNYLSEVISLRKRPKFKKIKGKSLFLSTMGAGSVYGEWVTGLIPKIGFMYGFDLKYSNFDYIIINSITKSWQKEFIKMLNIPIDKLIETNGSQSFIFEELYVPFGSGHSLKGFDFLKNIGKELQPKSSVHKGKRYFLSRNRDKWMKVLNEGELHNVLKKHSIDLIYIQDYDVVEQIHIFQESELIISPQGSGLTNVVFSNPKTKFIELYAESNLNSTFQCYGYYNGNPYGSIICKDIHSGHGDKFNIIVDPNELDILINKIIALN